jgi:hypothetical protein
VKDMPLDTEEIIEAAKRRQSKLAAKGQTIVFCPKRRRWVLAPATKERPEIIEREVAHLRE